MAQAKLALRPPTACSACYGQYPDRVHVDFRSAMEGLLVDPDNPRGPRVDWVVMCDECIRHAFSLLPEQADALANLRRRIEAAEQRAEDAENYASSLEDALSHRPERLEPPARPKPKAKPQQRGPRQPRYQGKAAA